MPNEEPDQRAPGGRGGRAPKAVVIVVSCLVLAWAAIVSQGFGWTTLFLLAAPAIWRWARIQTRLLAALYVATILVMLGLYLYEDLLGGPGSNLWYERREAIPMFVAAALVGLVLAHLPRLFEWARRQDRRSRNILARLRVYGWSAKMLGVGAAGLVFYAFSPFLVLNLEYGSPLSAAIPWGTTLVVAIAVAYSLRAWWPSIVALLLVWVVNSQAVERCEASAVAGSECIDPYYMEFANYPLEHSIHGLLVVAFALLGYWLATRRDRSDSNAELHGAEIAG